MAPLDTSPEPRPEAGRPETAGPALVVDPHLRLLDFSDAAGKLLNLCREHVGKPVDEALGFGELNMWFKDAVAENAPEESQMRHDSGNWFSVRIQPLRETGGKKSLITLLPLEQERSAARSQAELIVDALPHPVLLVDAAVRVVAANRSFHHVFQTRPGEVEGQTFGDINQRRWDDEVLIRHLRAVIDQGRSFSNFDAERVLPLIGVRHFSISGRPLSSDGGQKMALLCFDDVTRHRASEIELQKRSEELSRSNTDLEHFANVAAHDLQAPLTKIMGFAGLLLERSASLSEKDRRYLETIRNSSQRMKELIEDLLNFARITTAKAPFQRVELNAVLAEVTGDLDEQLTETKGRVVADPLPDIRGKQNQIYQLFLNLLSNAIKFRHPDRPPLIRISHRPVSERDVEVVVEDNGIGFDQTEAERLFKPFQRLHSQSEYKGTGIGLATCKRVAQLHGGDIRAASRPGEGTTFIVRLPVGF